MTYRLQSPPMRVMWEGWQSDTYTLSRAGWDIAVEEHLDISRPFDKTLRVIMHNSTMKLYGYAILEYDYMRHMQDPDYWKEVTIGMKGVSSDIIIREMGHSTFDRFKLIDAEPQYIETVTQFSKLNLFRQINSAPESEIILAQPSLDEVLDLALSLQEPRQKEIRQEILKRKAQADFKPDEQVVDMKAKLMLVA